MFHHRNSHKHTWTSPVGKTHNEIDHILIDRRRQSSTLKVLSFGGADYDTDHYLVVVNIREILKVNKQAAHELDRERFNLRRLKNLEVKKDYQPEITNRYTA